MISALIILFLVYELKEPFSVLTNDISSKFLVLLCVFQPRGALQTALKGHIGTLRQIHNQQIIPMEQAMVMPHCVSLFSVLIIMLADLFG